MENMDGIKNFLGETFGADKIATEVVHAYDSKGDIINTSITETVDDRLSIRTGIDSDGRETKTAILDGNEYRLYAVSETGDGGTTYRFDGEVDRPDGDERVNIEFKYDSDGNLIEAEGHCDKSLCGLDYNRENAVFWSEYSCDKVVYHEDGSCTKTQIDCNDGYRGDIGHDRFSERTYDSDGNLKTEAFFSAKYEADTPSEERVGTLTVVEHSENGEERKIIIEGIDVGEVREALQDVTQYDREITYTENGEVTIEFLMAGDPMDVEEATEVDSADGDTQSAEMQDENGEINPDTLSEDLDVDENDGEQQFFEDYEEWTDE